jgi:hypothetical protein
MEIKKKAKKISTEDFYYDLIEGGYIDPKKLLSVYDAVQVLDAIKILKQFQQTLEENKLIEYR